MWSINVFMNKLMKAYEEKFEVSFRDHLNLTEDRSVLSHFVELCCTTSIWTVDLAYLLQKFAVRFTYCTVTLGANPDFCVETFYKDQLPNDLVRVNMLFREAREAGIDIECRSLSATEISGLILSGKYVAIALVDQFKLSNSGLEDVCVSDFYGGNPGYTGHYVVICGYDAVTNEFEIRDPASSETREGLFMVFGASPQIFWYR
ncbi:Complement component 1 Q subcomponent-binding protein, mitochondrial [Castilleja foliolosa]|uniref:Complement component 1 Q subcomponent-binding protein, mitochondrial n=1 Tax=Castilleja foliolosa TaxID=1961234 RepID=A0ABD3E6U9_9LAMI